MKKLLAIIVLGLLWANTSFAETKISDSVWVVTGSLKTLVDNPYRIRFNSDGTCIYYPSKKLPCVWNQRGNKLFYEVNYYSRGNVTINNNKFSGSVVNNTNDKWTVTAKAEYISNKLDPKNEDVNEVEASSGTAFFVTDQGHLITNNHVVEGCKDKSKIVYKNQEYPAKLIAKDKNLDFALLKADLSKNRFIELSENPPKKLQKIIAAGYPLGKFLSDDLKFTSGIVSSLKGYNDDSTLIQIDAALNPGNSGGPIVDENNGKLVAVAVAGLRKDKTEAVNFGIKSNSLRNFLNANQMKLQSKQLFSFGKNIDVSQILEESTVYTFCK